MSYKNVSKIRASSRNKQNKTSTAISLSLCHGNGISHRSFFISLRQNRQKAHREKLCSSLRDSFPCVLFIAETVTGARNAHYVPRKVIRKCTIRFKRNDTVSWRKPAATLNLKQLGIHLPGWEKWDWKPIILKAL